MSLALLTITATAPRGGPATTVVTITGQNFGPPTGQVMLDPLGTKYVCAVSSWGPAQIIFTVPTILTQQLDSFLTLAVISKDGTQSASTDFWIPAAVPGPLDGLGYALPGFEEGAEENLDDNPRVIKARDFNRLLDRVGAGGGGSVPSTRNINTTPPLEGGGDLAADLTLSVEEASANNVLAGPPVPASPPANPAFRLLVAADIPDIPLSNLLQSGAAVGQAPVWNGTEYAPGTTSAPPTTDTWGGTGANPPPTMGQTVYSISQTPNVPTVKFAVNGVTFGINDGAFTVSGAGNQTVTWLGYVLGPTDIVDITYFTA
jgi:hypothetical protein